MLITQVLVRLVGADDHVYPNFIDVMQWLAESNLLEMIVDKLSPSVRKRLHLFIFLNKWKHKKGPHLLAYEIVIGESFCIMYAFILSSVSLISGCCPF